MPDSAAADSRTVFRLAFAGPWAALALTALSVLALGSPSRGVQLLPFAASILVFGLPHGAVDHLTPPWARDEPMTRRWLAVVGLLYLVVGLLYTGIWFLTPVVGFVLFISITWFHWGQGELHPLLRLVEPTHLRSRTAKALTITARGSLPMAVPLVAFPGEYRWVAERLVGLFGAADLAALDPLFSAPGRTAVAATVGALVIAALAVSYPGRNHGETGTESRRAWRLDAAELLLLTGFFIVVPPILAVGVFFCCWHSVRHITRLMLLDAVAAASLAEGDLRAALGRFGRQATPLTLGALVAFGGLALAVPVAPVGWADLFALYLVGIAVLTAPHVVMVSWLDVETGLWGPTEATAENAGS